MEVNFVVVRVPVGILTEDTIVWDDENTAKECVRLLTTKNHNGSYNYKWHDYTPYKKGTNIVHAAWGVCKEPAQNQWGDVWP